MKRRIIWESEGREVHTASKAETPEFYQLYQQAIFSFLYEEGLLSEISYHRCIDTVPQAPHQKQKEGILL